MAVGDGAGGFFDLKPLAAAAVHDHAARHIHHGRPLNGGEQAAAEQIVVVRAAQAHHFVHVVARGVKRLPPGQALCHGVQVGDASLRVRAHHGVADGLQRQPHALFLVKQLVFHALALGDVGHLLKNTAHGAAIGVRHI